jgi:hypothetical protein
MSNTVAEQTGVYFERLVDVYYKQFGCSGSVSAFDLYRRETAGISDDLGVPNDPYSKIYTAVTCAIVDLKHYREGAFDVIEEGQIQHPIRWLVTSLLDVRAGDSLILAQDGRGYGVDRAARFGTLMALVVDRAISQIG